ncbi:interleukin-20 receptor subunit alpha [Trichomycterus rosablanca]|uniref:interleukin-20 receptor subunit alpha n=1 Tax=Trichomycterus rosablanca TaxID=2290929 RepID=UPI002F360761
MYKLLLLVLCALLQAASVFPLLSADRPEVSAPRQVRFHSINLKNTVLWNPGKRTIPGTTYTVEYSIYGDAVEVDGIEQVVWRLVPHCSRIITTECDVTNQTDDTEEEYFVRVKANGPQTHSAWTETSGRFKPMMDTILGAPRVTLHLEDNYLHIKLKGPFRWRSSETKGPSMLKIIPFTVYNVTVNNKMSNSVQEYFPVENESLKLGPLEYSSEHCVMAEALSRSLPLISRHSDWSCITVPEDPVLKWIRVLLLGVVIPTSMCLFVLAAVGGFAYYYIWGHKQKLPKSTDLVHIEEKHQTLQPEKPLTIINVNIINANLNAKEPKLSPFSSLHHHITEEPPLLPPAVLHQPPVHVGVAPSYAAQQQLHHLQHIPSSGPEWQQDSLSDDYGFVQREENIPAATDMPTTAEVNQYRTQDCGGEAEKERYEEQITKEEEEEEEGEMSTFLNWDPETRVLKIPLLGQFDSDDTTEMNIRTEPEMKVDTSLLLLRPVLTSVVVRQSSEDSGEEDAFTKMEKDWGLRINCNAE